MFDIITIGTATKDTVLKSAHFKTLHSKRGPVKDYEIVPLGSTVDVGDVFFSTGGTAINAATTFARQGFRTGVVTRIGNDSSANDIRRDCTRDGVDFSRAIVDGHHATAHSIILLHNSGERTVLAYKGACQHWESRDFHKKALDARWFYIGSLGGNFEALGEIIAIARKHNIRIAMNPGLEELKLPHKLVPHLFSIDVLIMNREEGALFTGVSAENESDIFKRIDELEPGIFVLTDGSKGVWVSDGVQRYKVGIYDERSVVDRTGVGDAFGSGFVSGVMRRLDEKSRVGENTPTLRDLEPPDIAYAIRLGSANATACIEGVGAKHGLLTRHQFERGLHWHGLEIRTGNVAHTS
ncbi:MAG: carbohydrate kinase family protein [Patescibacteria group bacterium]